MILWLCFYLCFWSFIILNFTFQIVVHLAWHLLLMSYPCYGNFLFFSLFWQLSGQKRKKQQFRSFLLETFIGELVLIFSQMDKCFKLYFPNLYDLFPGFYNIFQSAWFLLVVILELVCFEKIMLSAIICYSVLNF